MNYTEQEEIEAKKEYLLMIGALTSSQEFSNEWAGEWDDFEKQSFGKKSQKIKGDKNKYMKYWLENQEIINDSEWDKINLNDEWDNDY